MDESIYLIAGVIGIVAYAISGWQDGRARSREDESDAKKALSEVQAIREFLASMHNPDPVSLARMEDRIDRLELKVEEQHGEQMAEILGRIKALEKKRRKQ